MSGPIVGFEADWLAARRRYDEAALDRQGIALIVAWAAALPAERVLTVVDLGSGTGTALQRAVDWLAPHPLGAYAVDADAALLAQISRSLGGVRGTPASRVTPLVGDLLAPLDDRGGPADGTVDLVLGHALADLLPLDRLATRVAALVRPGGLAHLALTYDGLTAFESTAGPADLNPDLDRRMIAAFHHQMDRPATCDPSYGGSTAGRRLAPALAAAGLDILLDAPAIWHVRAADGAAGQTVLRRLIRYVAETVGDGGSVPEHEVRRWHLACHTALANQTLQAHVGHRDALTRKLDRRAPRQTTQPPGQ